MKPCIACLVALVVSVWTDPIAAAELSTVRLKTRTFTPEAGYEALDQALDRGASSGHFYVQLSGPLRPETRELLAQTGVRLLQYIPDHTWVAGFDEGALSDPAVRENLDWVGAILPEDKMPPRWAESGPGEWARRSGGRYALRIRLHDDVDRDAAAARLQVIGADVGEPLALFVGITATAAEAALGLIAEMDEVLWLTEALPPIELENDGNRNITNAEVAQSAPYNLSGQDVRIGIWDGGRVDPNHDDFAGRLTLGETASTSNHGTHVAGTFGGSGILSQTHGGSPLQWRGMAPGCLIYSWDFNGSVIDEIIDGVQEYDLDIETNSWGFGVNGSNCEDYGDYDGLAPEFDAIVAGAGGRRLNVVFSAGNERNDGDCPLVEGGYGCINMPKPAKNVIVVGATNSDDDSMTDFSSWGPVDDGRLKPDVTAPGCERFGEGYVHSTLPGDTYGGPGYCGTSMAAPTCAGCLALLYEVHYAEHGGAEPEPSLMKGLLVTSARDLGNPGPDYAFGHGRIDVRAAADALLHDTQVVVEIAHGETWEYAFPVPDGTPALRVASVWDDPPASPLSDPALVNDLDLVLIDPEGGLHYPWILDPEHPSGNATRGPDHLNNVEHVEVDNPIAGLWQARITGANLPEGPQIVSLVGLDLRAPGPPVDFAVAGVTENSVDLTWVSASDADRAGTLIVRAQGPAIWPGPTDGETYDVGQVIGPGLEVVYAADEDHSEDPFTDGDLTPNVVYVYTAYTFDDMRNYSDGERVTVTPGYIAVEAAGGVPTAVALGSARPNPAYQQASLSVAVPEAGPVRLRVYDAAGRLVRTLLHQRMDAGNYRVTWDGRDPAGNSVAPGIYFYELRANGERLSRRLAWLP